jgi:hypothetical protein
LRSPAARPRSTRQAHTHPVSCKKSRDMYKLMNWKTRAKVAIVYFEYFSVFGIGTL